ncbi:hypothetical protein SALBM217S_06978 [Streptomyces griseoloalbus]
MALGLGVREPLHQEHPDTLTPSGTVRALRERLAPAVPRQTTLAVELGEDVRGGHHRHAARQRHVALPRPQGLHREMQRHQGGRAGGVHRDRRTFQPQDVGHPARHHARGVAGEQVSFDAVGQFAARVGAVVLVAATDEHAGPASAHGGGGEARAFERLPGGLQDEPLLGVHGQRLARRDAEEPGVELGRRGDEPAVPRGGRCRVAVGVPAPVDRERGHGVDAGVDQPPQVVRTGHVTRVAAGHADDGYRLVRRAEEFLVVPAKALVLEQGRAQRGDDALLGGGHAQLHWWGGPYSGGRADRRTGRRAGGRGRMNSEA